MKGQNGRRKGGERSKEGGNGPGGEGRKSRTISSTDLMDRLQTIDQAAEEIAPLETRVGKPGISFRASGLGRRQRKEGNASSPFGAKGKLNHHPTPPPNQPLGT